MTLKKCMSIAKSLTNTQHMELEPLCSGSLSRDKGSSKNPGQTPLSRDVLGQTELKNFKKRLDFLF